MRPAAMDKGLEFEVVESEGLPAQIRTDPVRLRQCLINLINNAIKFTDEGHVYLNVSLEELDGKAFIRFDVEDTGIGVAADKQEAIFESFEQVDGGSTRKYSGTGLGLAITKQLANLLGGELTLTSEAGKGSVFSLVIPAGLDVKSQPFLDRHSLVDEPDKKQEQPDESRFSGRVLVAEDSLTNQMLIKLLLEKMGFEVTIVVDGNQVVQKALSQAFDLILMDIQMPNMNGYEATKTLRRKEITTPIVALTAHAMKGDKEKCISAGCDDYLSKPIDRRELLKLIYRYLPCESEALSKTIDSVKSEVDELRRLCSDRTSLETQSGQLVSVRNSEDVIDWACAMNVCNDENVIKETVRAILEDGPQCIKSIAEAVKAENPADVRLYAHRLKGAAMTIGARRLSEKACRLECAGEEKDVAAAASLFDDVQGEFEKLKLFLSGDDWIQRAKQQENNK